MADLEHTIPYITLNDGKKIPQIGFGLGTTHFKATPGAVNNSTVEIAKTAVKLGYHHLDGAEVYNNEEELGQTIKECKVPRDQLFVTTKVINNPADISGSLDVSLKKLGVKHVDLYLLHAPFSNNESELQKWWADMESIQASGRATSIGVSNFQVRHLEAILKTAKVKPAINQVEYHLYLQRENLISFCKEHGIQVAAYGPQMPITRGSPGPADSVLAALARKYFVSEGDICLRWVIEKGGVVITTSTKETRLSDYLRVLAFKLTPKEIEELEEAGQKKKLRHFMKKYVNGEDDYE